MTFNGGWLKIDMVGSPAFDLDYTEKQIACCSEARTFNFIFGVFNVGISFREPKVIQETVFVVDAAVEYPFTP